MTPLADEEQTQNRAEILNRAFQGLLFLNGGGCVTLLAFLQAAWEDITPDVMRGLLCGTAFFIGGLALTIIWQYMRYETSLAIQFKKRRGMIFQFLERASVVAALLAFLFGASLVIGYLYQFSEDIPQRDDVS